MRLTPALMACRCLFSLRNLGLLAWVGFGVLAPAHLTPSRAAPPQKCNGDLPEEQLIIGAEAPDLVVDKRCYVRGGAYYYRHVNIIAGGNLIFVEPKTESGLKGQDFWATSIIIENKGAIYAGVTVPADNEMVGVKPYGTNKMTLTFHLYGADPRGSDVTKSEGPGESCVPVQDKNRFADCGIPLKNGEGKDVWTSNGKEMIKLPGGVTDYFYQYGSLHGDEGTSPDTGQEGHFGYKVMALSYGGLLRLRGLKGTTGTSDANIATMLKNPYALTAADDAVITNSGTSWGRLTAGGDKNANKLTIDRPVRDDWQTNASAPQNVQGSSQSWSRRSRPIAARDTNATLRTS